MAAAIPKVQEDTSLRLVKACYIACLSSKNIIFNTGILVWCNKSLSVISGKSGRRKVVMDLLGKGVCILNKVKLRLTLGSNCSCVVQDHSAFDGCADHDLVKLGSIWIFPDAGGITCLLVSFQSFIYIA